MIYGLGVDIVEIKRLKKAIDRWGKSFLNRVFTEKEIKYAKSKKFLYQHLAGRFAAKEAVIKSLGGAPLEFKDIEITNSKSGKPSCKIHQKFNSLKNREIFISISHGKDYAVAQAIIEKKG